MNKNTAFGLSALCMTVIPLYTHAFWGNGGKAAASQRAMVKKEEAAVPSKQIQEITPPAPALVKHAIDPFFTAEYIYWKAEETGLEYAISGITTDPRLSVHGKGRLHEPHFQYHSGFKVGAGLKFRHDSWDVYANYTWLFSDHDHGSTERKEGQSLQNIWYLADDGIQYHADFERASSQWSLHFNALDVELGRNYFISHRLTLRPHFGLKASWIEQDLSAQYKNGVNLDVPLPNQARYHFDQDQQGLGIRTGLNTAWFMWNKWSLFGNFAAALLYSDFDIHQKNTLQSTLGKFTYQNFHKHIHTIIPVIELSLGLRFQTDFYKQHYQFLLQVGWEEQIWFDMNQFSNLSNRSNGNLTMQGLTLKTGFAF